MPGDIRLDGGELDQDAALASPDLYADAGLEVVREPLGEVAEPGRVGLGTLHGRLLRRRPLGELVYDDRWDGAASWASDPDGTRHTSAGPPR